MEPDGTHMTNWKDNEVEEYFSFMHDALKNVTSIFDAQQERRISYDYAPFGNLTTMEGDMAKENKFCFSCEYMDHELGLIYYNYRHLNPLDGRWISRDPKGEVAGLNLMRLAHNAPIRYADILGLNEVILCGGCNSNTRGLNQDDHPLLPSFIKAVLEHSGFDLGGKHDQNWANFITASEKEIKRRKKVLKKGEKIERIVDYSSYSIRGVNDGRGEHFYINIIEKKLKNSELL